MFTLQNTDLRGIEIPGLNLVPYEYENKTAKFDLTLIGMEIKEKLFLRLEYSTRLFKETSIERFKRYFLNLVKQATEKTRGKICDFELITAEEKKRILFEFNDTEREYPKDKTIHELFAGQVEKSPDHVGVVGQVGLSYRKLNEQSDQLAGLLIEKGVLPDSIVGIMVGRCVEMVIGLMGILKSGCAYLPIDPELPRERTDYMLKDSGAKFLVNEKFFAPLFFKKAGRRGLHHSNQLAYIIYTSGSTGKPKGVMVEHRSLVNLCWWHNNYYSVTSWDRASKYAGFGFDASVWEIFPYLAAGASLYIVPDEIILDIAALNGYFERNGITIGFLPTQICEEFLLLRNTSLRVLLVGGDRLKNYVSNNYALYNNYGPTENTVVSTSFCVTGGLVNIPIGAPIFNNRVFIMDRYHRLQPIGVPGEIVVGGDSVARGYLNRPELTAEKFIKYRSYKTDRTYINYKTGDLGRWLESGNIEFLGRVDQQVKIRGARVELAEIENELLTHPGIREAVVVAKEGNDGQYLCAYLTPKDSNDVEPQDSLMLTRELQDYLLNRLPHYMVPGHFVMLEKMPLTSSGKVDRRLLSSKNEFSPVSGVTYVAPGNDMEQIVADIWKEILHLEEVGIHDNFFALGGSSITLLKVNSRLEIKLEKSLPVVKMFKYPTVHTLSSYLLQGDDEFPASETIEKEKLISGKMDRGKDRLKERSRRRYQGK
jgi:amino acid adenylation domain-containing protein